jgi:hypothetical protein
MITALYDVGAFVVVKRAVPGDGDTQAVECLDANGEWLAMDGVIPQACFLPPRVITRHVDGLGSDDGEKAQNGKSY